MIRRKTSIACTISSVGYAKPIFKSMKATLRSMCIYTLCYYVDLQLKGWLSRTNGRDCWTPHKIDGATDFEKAWISCSRKDGQSLRPRLRGCVVAFACKVSAIHQRLCCCSFLPSIVICTRWSCRYGLILLFIGWSGTRNWFANNLAEIHYSRRWAE